MASNKPKTESELSQPLFAAPMPEYPFQLYEPASSYNLDRDETEDELRKIDLSDVVLNLS